MKLEKKIFLEKTDDLDKAVSDLISASAEKIVLNIPKNSVLGLSVHNFQVLERESKTASKELAIESVDERVLELASLAAIPAANPIFRTKERAVADILPRDPGDKKKPARKTRTKTKMETPETPEIAEKEEPIHKKPKRGNKFWRIIFLILVVVFGGGYFTVADILPQAAISISIKKTTVPFTNAVTVDINSNAPTISGNAINLPGQLSVAKNNLSMNFPATGKSAAVSKAGGMLAVYNSYNSQPQILVATTRFESPEGKIFRLVNKTTIPGAKTADGKTTPGSVDVQVIADQPGPDYNVAPSQGWKIPGFKGTPRYDKFYAEAKSSMTGGASGDQIIPTSDDIQNAKIKIENALADGLKSQTLILNSQNLRILDNASAFNVASETISSQADQDNNFSVFAAGELKQLVFDEKMLRDVIVKSLSTSTTEIKIDDLPINYGTSTVDLAAGKMSFSISGALVYEPKIDFNDFKKQILGREADSLKAMIFALPGLQKANILFRPFWVNSVPRRESRVNIMVGD